MGRQVETPKDAGRGPSVVFLVRSFGFPEGMAATNRVRLLGRMLLLRGGRARVICTRVSELPGEARNVGTSGCVDGISYFYAPGSTIRSDSFILRRWREARGFLVTLVSLWRQRAAGDLDCVILADGGSQLPGLSIFLLVRWLRLLGVSVVSQLNDLPPTRGMLPAVVSRQLSLLSGVDGTVAISGWLARWALDEARRIGRPVDIIQIPILVDVTEQEVEPRARQSRDFVYAASTEYVHDLAFVLESMRHVWHRFPDATLTVTGMRPARVAELAAQLGVEEGIAEGRLRPAGYLERQALLAEYQRASALLIPLHVDLKSRARFPSKIGEYLASGRPVITSRVGEVERYLDDGETAYLAVPGDVESFAGNMAAVFDDPAHAEAVGAAGRRVAENVFSYTLYSGALVDFVSRAPAGGSSRAGGA